MWLWCIILWMWGSICVWKICLWVGRRIDEFGSSSVVRCVKNIFSSLIVVLFVVIVCLLFCVCFIWCYWLCLWLGCVLWIWRCRFRVSFARRIEIRVRRNSCCVKFLIIVCLDGLCILKICVEDVLCLVLCLFWLLCF